MSEIEFVNEPVLVEARILPNGRMQPRAFTWQGQTRRVTGSGREWHEEVNGVTWHCYLIHTSDGSRFDLRLDPAGGRWLLARAWLNPGLV